MSQQVVVSKSFDVCTESQGAALTLTLPPLSYALLRRLDCRRSLADVRRPNPSPRPNSSNQPLTSNASPISLSLTLTLALPQP